MRKIRDTSLSHSNKYSKSLLDTRELLPMWRAARDENSAVIVMILRLEEVENHPM
jgi:hypothetical protein